MTQDTMHPQAQTAGAVPDPRDDASVVPGQERTSFFHQPTAVWATAMAAVFAFMGIGLVDPILPAIAQNLRASPAQVSLLFTSYFLVTAIGMLVTGFVSSRIGGKKTLLLGLALIVVFASLAGSSPNVATLVGFRAGWGLGNSLFVATALAVIVAVASGGTATAIILYEAALGLGLSLGPILGAILGGWHWRAPFFGTATLMAAAFAALAFMLPTTPVPAVKTRLRDPILALGHKGLRTAASSAVFYNFGYFTILAYTPFVLGMNAYGIGAVFFTWGALLALFSVFVAPWLQARFGTVHVMSGTLAALMVDLVALAGAAATHTVLLVVIMTDVSGALFGINNTLYTEVAMSVSDAPRPVASAGYNFARWMGGAIAPFVATSLGEDLGPQVSYVFAASTMVVAAVILVAGRRVLIAHEPAAT
jgi:MFS family permease